MKLVFNFLLLCCVTILLNSCIKRSSPPPPESKKINKQNLFNQNSPDQNYLNKSSIVNGEIVTNLAAPYNSIVGLYDQEQNFTCTGVLVAKGLVLTAAHCIENNGDGLLVYFTDDLYKSIDLGVDPLKNKQVREVLLAVPHENYLTEEMQLKNDYDWNDIAILKFNGDTPHGFLPIDLDLDQPKIDSEVIVAGFGVSTVTREPVSGVTDKELEDRINAGTVICYGKIEKTMCYNVVMDGDGPLRSSKVKVVEQENTEFVTDEQITGTCLGDSGGPVFRQSKGHYMLTGITSRGANTCNVDGVYTSIASQMTWIKKQLQKLN